MTNKVILLDLDGVILDSELRIRELIKKFKPYTETDWQQFFDNIEWDRLLRNSKSINNSVEIIREL